MPPTCDMAALTPNAQRLTPNAYGLTPALLAGIVIPVAVATAMALTNELRVVAAVIGLIAVAALVLRPFWGLCIFVALMYSRLEDGGPLQGMHIAIVVSVATAAALAWRIWGQGKPAVRTPMNGMLTGFLVAAGLSAILAGNPITAMLDVSKLVILVLLILNVVRTPDRYQAFVTCLLVCTAYMAGYALFQYYTGHARNENGLLRLEGTGPFGDPNDCAAAIDGVIVLALARMTRCKPLAVPLYAAVTAMLAWAVMLTHSRGGVVALAVGAGVFLLSTRRPRLIAALALVVIAAAVFAGESGQKRTADSLDESSAYRLMLWNRGFDEFAGSPIVGIGYSKFEALNPMTAHNSWVLCFTELGVVGYFFWMGALYYAFRKHDPEPAPSPHAEADRRDQLAAKLGLLAYLIASFWLSHTYIPILYVFLALPSAHQAAHTGATELTPRDGYWPRDWGFIAALGAIFFVAIRFIAWGHA